VCESENFFGPGGPLPLALAAAAAVLSPPALWAEAVEEAPDKSHFSLLHPTPRALLRPLAADRPDKTESAFTVDAGHFQIESDFANLTYDRHNEAHTNTRVLSYEILPTTLKVGILNNLDLQLAIGPHGAEQVEDKTTPASSRKSGFGDLTPRLKLNLVGNDGGPFALALLPFIKIPTSQDNLGNDAIEGGLKIPWALEMGVWDVALQQEVDWFRDQNSAGYHPEVVNSLSIGRPVFGKLSLYGEFYSSVSTERGVGWIGTFDTWVTYQLTENLRLDAGVYIGLTRAADDWHPFVGMTWRY
jgi:hypothetical protein